MSVLNLKLPWHWLPWQLAFTILVTMATSCPMQQGCNCEMNNGKSIINCRYQSLTRVPSVQPTTETYYELTLAQNSITSLEDNAFQGLNIQVLDLSDNPINSISTSAFAGLSSLTELILHVNAISAFPSQALQKLTNLRKLTIKGFSLNTLPDNSFTGLSQITSLTLDKCRISALSAAVVLPFQNSLQYLNLIENRFTALPTALSQLPNLQTLVLSKNQMTSLNAGAFSANTKLQELDLSYMGLETLNSATFQGLENSLKMLHLHNNRLTATQLVSLSQLQALTELNLSNNNINALTDSGFSRFVQLKNLKLTSNKITGIRRATFEGLSGLLFLDVSYNDIQTIEEGAFEPLSSLVALELDHQVRLVSALQASTFTAIADTLRNLSMKETGFNSGKWSTISTLTGLTTLDLSNNDLRSIPDLAFSTLTNLQTLDLSHNSIADILPTNMYGLQNTLKRITLDNNDITSISVCVFKDFNLERISLTSNPLDCDCHLQWLRQWVKDKYDEFTTAVLGWGCSQPAAHNNKLFKDLRVEDFVCNPVEDEPECVAISPITSTKKPGISTTQGTPSITGLPLFLNVSNITATSCKLSWYVILVEDIEGFTLEYNKFEEHENMDSVRLGADIRSYNLEGLKDSTTYVMCVTMRSSREQAACVDVQTLSLPVAGETKKSVTAGIIGGVLGGLAFLAIVIIVAFLLWRRKSEKDWGGAGGGGLFHTQASGTLPSAANRPQMGYNSKRFSKAKTFSTDMENSANKDFEGKLANLTKEERDQILNFLTNSGGSTLSMISSGSSQRYVPDLPPRPPHLEGYLNPVSVKSDESSESIEDHIYSDIEGAYSDIGMNAHYDNNNLRKTEPIPPIPEDSYI